MTSENSLSVDANDILSATGPDERPASIVSVAEIFDLFLNTRGADEAAFCVFSLESVPVGDMDLDKTVRQIRVQRVPFNRGVGFVSEDDLDEEQIRQGVSHSLVDELSEVCKMFDSSVLRRARRFVGFQFRDG